MEIQKFIEDGFVKINNAFSQELARECREILWRETGFDPHDSKTWTAPVVRLGYYSQEPFRLAVNTPVLHDAFDKLVGAKRWSPRADLGTIPVRFPSEENPGDDGWHVEASFPGETETDFMTWRINVESKGRALLMLFLFSDVGENDAPTRIRTGSHLDVARILRPFGESGLSFMELAGRLDATANHPQTSATGKAGTVYLCHPFLVHAAQAHHGANPRFMAQPPLHPAEPIQLNRADGDYSPIEIAIRSGAELNTADFNVKEEI